MENLEYSSPSAVSTPSSSLMVFTPKTFTSSIAHKLNEENFLPWKHEALASIKGHKLQNHLNKTKILAKCSLEEDEAANIESEEYSNWEQQDHYLIFWLLASMDSAFKNRMVGCNFAHEIWNKIETYFALQTRAKIKQLKTQLRAIKKQGSTVADYLLKIKKIVDALAALGAPVSTEDHIEVILDGLNEDYSAFITSVTSRVEPFSINELEALLMAREEIIERFRKLDLAIVQVI